VAEAAAPTAPAPGVAPVVAAFAAAALAVAGAGLAYAQLATMTVFECDRGTDACVVYVAKPYWTDEIDRFPAAKLREATHFERTMQKGATLNCVALRVDSRTEPVEICGRAGPDFAERINAFVAERDRPRFIAQLDASSGGRLLAQFLLACSIPPLLAGVFLLRRVLRAR
jgi:hypothetical protein